VKLLGMKNRTALLILINCLQVWKEIKSYFDRKLRNHNSLVLVSFVSEVNLKLATSVLYFWSHCYCVFTFYCKLKVILIN